MNFAGDNSVQTVLVIVGNIYSTPFTFAAVLKDYAFTAFLYDGSVATWTSKHFGVNSIVETVLLGSVMILLTSYGLAIVLNDGSVATWGSKLYGGGLGSAQMQMVLLCVDKIYSTDHGFALVLYNCSVVTWCIKYSSGN